jgi:hypothetical protein
MIAVHDLVGRAHEPLRCIGYAHLALRRLFPDFDPAEIPSTPEAAQAWLANPPLSRWREIGRSIFSATREGDVVYGEDDSEVGAYVAVLVDVEGGGFITSDAKRGCEIRTRRKLIGVKSVQRRT